MDKNYFKTYYFLFILFSLNAFAGITYERTDITDEYRFASFHNSLFGAPTSNDLIDSIEARKEIIEFYTLGYESRLSIFEVYAIQNCPISPITQNASNENCYSVVTYTEPTTDDLITYEIIRTSGFSSGSQFPVGTTTVTFEERRRVDGFVNETCTFDVIITDNEQPIISCPFNSSENRVTDPNFCTYTINGDEFNATASDNCSVTSLSYVLTGDTTGSGTNLNGEVLNPGTTTVTWTASDGFTTDATCSFDVIVMDGQQPELTCPVATLTTRDTDPDECYYTINGTEFNALVLDNCTVTSLSYELTGDTTGNGTDLTNVVLNPGTTTVTWTGSDGVTTNNECDFDVVIEDNQSPNAVCQNIIIELDASGNASIIASNIDNGSSDNCGNVSLSVDKSAFNCNDLNNDGSAKDQIVVLTVDDGNGNIATCNATVTVQPYTSPATVSYTITQNKSTICDSETLDFVAQPSGLGGNTATYEWFINAGGDYSSPAGSGSTFSYSNWTSPNDIVEVVMYVGTATCAPIKKYQSTITVNAEKPVSFTITGPTSICEGGGAIYNISNPINIGSNPVYQWKLNGSDAGANSSSFDAQATGLLALNGPNLISLEVTSNALCANPNTPQQSTNTIDLIINPNSTIDNPGNKSPTVCINTNIDPIIFSIEGGGTGATTTGLPPGVIGNYFGGSYTLSGSPTASGVFNYTVTTTGGGCGQVSQTGVITVNPDVTINKNAADSNIQTVCSDQNISQIRYNIGGSGNGANITWSGGTPTFATNYNAGVFTISGTTNVTSTTTYNYTVTGTGLCASASLTGSITVNPNLTPTISIIASDDNICSGDSVTFTIDSQTNTGSSPTYQWQIGTNPVNGANGNSFTTNSLNNGESVSVILTSSATCTTSSTATSTGIPITVNPNLTPSVSIVSNDPDNTICTNESVTFTATPTNGGLSPLYQWKINGVNVGSNSTTNTFTTTALTDGQTVTVVMTSNEDCLAVDTATSSGISTTVLPTLNPAVSIASSDADNNICQGTVPTFTATPTNGGSSPLYQWKVNGTNVGGNTAVSTFTPSSLSTGDIVSVEMTTNYQCASEATASNSSSSHTVYTVLSPPTISGPTAVCPNNQTVTYSVPVNTNVLTYNWTVPSGFVISSGQGTRSINVQFTTPSTGVNSITLQTSNPCTTLNTNYDVTINSFAAVDAGPDQYLCPGDSQINLAMTTSGAITKNNQIDISSNAGGSLPGGQFDNRLTGTYTLPNNPPPIITLTITTTVNVNGCNGTKTDTMQIFTQTNPTASISSMASSVCTDTGTNIIFNATPNTTVTYKIGASGSNQTINVGGTGQASLPTGNLTSNTTYYLVSVKYTNTKACSQNLTSSTQITVNPNATIGNPANKNQSGCIGISMPNISFALGGGANEASVSGLPNGMSGIKTGTNFVISGTPTETGTFPYTINTTGTCTQASQTGTLTINPDATISDPTNEDQTLCINTALNNIVFDLGGGASGATVNGLPTGVTGNYNASGKKYTLSGTPSQSGSFPYTVTTTGTCAQVSHSGTLTINPDASVTTPANLDQSICEGDSIADIEFTISGGATGLTDSNLPTGLILEQDLSNPNLYRITGTATTAGTFNYTISTIGNCLQSSKNGTISILDDATITSPGNKDQITCINNAIANIAFAIGGTATSAIASGLPNGVSGSLSGSAFILSGIPTESGTFNYDVTTVGPCGNVTESGEITVNPNDSIIPPGTVDQTVCLNNGITDIIFDLSSGATNASTTGLPAGVSGNLVGDDYVISGSPTQAGTFNYTVTTSGLCEPATASGTLTVKDAVVITTHPTNNGICESETAIFSVGALGDDLTYQWYRGSGTIISDSPPQITGATTNTLTLTNTVLTDADDYYVIVSGNTVCTEVTSDTAELNVNQDITITSQPANVSQCEGGDISFTVEATGTIDSYQWYKGSPSSGTALTNDGDITGTDTNTLNIATVEASDDGNYYVVMTALSGLCPEATSSIAVLNVSLNAIVEAGPPQTICSDTAATLAGSITGGASAGLWSTDGDGKFSNTINSAQTDTSAKLDALYTPGANDITNGTVTLTLTSTNGAAVCNPGVDTVIITINEQPQISGDNDFCFGGSITLSPTSGGTWSSSDNSIATITNAGVVSSIAPGPVSFTFTNSTTSCQATSNIININPLPIITGESDVCIGDTINLSPSTGGTWQSNNPTVASINNSGVVTGLTDGTATFTFTFDNTLCSATSSIINVNPLPAISGEAPVCVGSTLQLSPSTNGTWMSNDTTKATISNAGLVTAVSSGNVTFTFTAAGTGCKATSTPVTINPSPNITGPSSLCVNGTINLTPNSGGTWVSNNPGIATITDQGLVTGMSNGTASFTFTTTGTGCSKTSNNITVNSLPIIGGPDEICVGTPVNLSPATGGTWTSSDPSKATITPLGTITGHSQGSVTVTYTNTTTNCTSSKNISVTPKPVGGAALFSGTDGTDRLFLICENPVPGSYTDNLIVSGKTGTIVKWEYRSGTDGWSTVMSDSSTPFTGTELSTGQLADIIEITGASTVFRFEVSSGICSPNAFSKTAIVSVIPANIKPNPVEVSKPVICLGEDVTLTSETGYGEDFGKFEGGAFDNSSITQHGWRITDKFGNTDYNFSSDADNRVPEKWLRTNPHPFTTANINSPYNTYDKLWQSNPTPAGNKGFAIVSGDNSSTLETSVFSLSGLDQAILTFDQAYNLTDPNTKIEVWLSTTGGTTNTTGPGNAYEIKLYELSGPVVSGNEHQFSVGPEGINKMTFDLGDYLGYPNLRVMFKYTGTRVGDIWTLDNIKVPEGPRDVAQEWNDTTDPENPIYIGSSNTETWTPTKIGWNTFQITTLIILDSAGNECTSVQNSEEVKVFAFDQYTSTALTTDTGTCGMKEAKVWAEVTGSHQGVITEYPTADGYEGEWVITPSTGFTVTNTDPTSTLAWQNDPNITFTADDLGSFNFSWILTPTAKDELNALIPNVECPPIIVDADVDLIDCSTLDWDGINDHVNFGDQFDLTSAFSLEVWIKPGGLVSATATNGTEVILSKHVDGNNGYSLELNNNQPHFNIYNGTTTYTATANGTLLFSNGKDSWHHLAVTFGGGTLKLYVDGILSDTQSATVPAETDYDFILGARSDGSVFAEDFYKGWMDELRIWNTALTEEQIHQMMNQEIANNGGVRGTVCGQLINGLAWSNLQAYYQMNVLNWDHTPDCINNPVQGDDVAGGYLLDNSGTGINGRLILIETSQDESAPIPYTTKQNGNWANENTWTYGNVWTTPNGKGFGGVDVDWNIVVLCHDVAANSKGRKSGAPEDNIDYVVGCLLSLQGELTVDDAGPAESENDPGIGLWVTHYLKVNGVIDLIGDSQLVQKRYNSNQLLESELDVTSSGHIERDQQGQLNMNNYNYFSSPVNNINSTINNGSYTVGSILMDGSNTSTPQPIGWTTNSYDTGGGIPISNSARWIYMYPNQIANTYLQWIYLGQNGSNTPGIGFTLKGSGIGQTPGTTLSGIQNYVFRGKPNNAEISLPLGGGNQAMVGNPYPSALSLSKFISDNAGVVEGSIYLWEHFSSNDTHILKDYRGGYAIANLTGGNPPYFPNVSNQTIDNFYIEGGTLADFQNTPGTVVPVGQGFFVSATNGGSINFNNSQRIFYREGAGESTFLRTRSPNGKTSLVDDIKRIRIDVQLPNNVVRPLMIGFVDNPKATDKYDDGYDARTNDAKAPADVFWRVEDENCLIQGVGNFDITKKYPLAIFSENKGLFRIRVRQLENFDEEINVFLYDDLLGTYSRINDISHKFSTDGITEVANRFYIAFQTDEQELEIPKEEIDKISVNYLHDNHEILIKTPSEINVKQIYLVNMIGQTVKSWNATNTTISHEMRIPVSNMAEGNYIIKLQTETVTVNKKVVITQ